MSGGEASAIYERIVTEDERKLNEELVGAYLDNVWLSGLTPMIMTDYESNLRIFATLLSKSGVEATKADLRAFVAYLKDKRDVHQKTIALYFSAISSFFDYFVYIR